MSLFFRVIFIIYSDISGKELANKVLRVRDKFFVQIMWAIRPTGAGNTEKNVSFTIFSCFYGVLGIKTNSWVKPLHKRQNC